MTLADFENADSWDVSTATLLPVGNFACTISKAEGGDTKNGNPQIELEVECDEGSRKDWLVYNSDAGVSKVATLYRSAGVKLSNEDQNDGVLTDDAIARLVGAKVGVVIREEDKYNGAPGEKVPRIKGYVPVESLKDVAPPAAAKSNGKTDDDISF